MFEKIDEEDALELLKPICGFVQAARQFWKKMVFILTRKINFEVSKVDPWLFTRTDEGDIVIVALYVDDCIYILEMMLHSSYLKED